MWVGGQAWSGFREVVRARMPALVELVELAEEAVTPPKRTMASPTKALASPRKTMASPKKPFEMWITDESLPSPGKEEGEKEQKMEVVKEDEAEKVEAVIDSVIDSFKEEKKVEVKDMKEVMESSLLLRSSTDEGGASDSDSDIVIEEVVDKKPKPKGEEKVTDLVETSEDKLGEERIASMLPPGLKVTVSKQKDSKAETEDERRPIEVTLDSSDEEDEKANSGVTVRRVVSSPRVKERVKSGSLVKERVGSGSKVKERVKSGSLGKERVKSGSKVKERVSSGSLVKERVVSGSRVKECSVRLVPVSAGAVGVCGECGQGAGRAALAPAPGALPEGRAVREEAISVISWEDSREHR